MPFQCSRVLSLVTVLLPLPLTLLARPAHAQIVINLTDTNPTVVSPSGGEAYLVGGSISNTGASPITLDTASITSPLRDNAGDSLNAVVGSDGFSVGGYESLAPGDVFLPGSTTNVIFYTLEIGENQAPGEYNRASNFTHDPSRLSLDFSDGQESVTNVGVLVTPPGSPLPEASTSASFGLLLALSLGGLMIAARRKKAIV